MLASVRRAKGVPRLSFGLVALFLAAYASAGCGVQGGHKTTADCKSIKKYAETSDAMKEIDLRIKNLRPNISTPDDLKQLVPTYREAAANYQRLATAAKTERDRPNRRDLAKTWDLQVRSLELRREGLEFFANAFAQPETLRDPAKQRKSREYERRTADLNAKFEKQARSMLAARGFHRRSNGDYEIAC